MRTSADEKLMVNGCTDTSWRPSNPRACTTALFSSSCLSKGKVPCNAEVSGCAFEAKTFAISGTSAVWTVLKSSLMRDSAIPVSKSSSNFVYTGISASPILHCATSFAVSKHSDSVSSKIEKSEASRALAHFMYASLPSWALRFSRASGTRLPSTYCFFISRKFAALHSPRASGPASTSAISPPICGSVVFSWITPARAALCRARCW
mmetsp:Transcript_4465/g.7825  ORF Transcript_4465/g.7825 Transcript_4465/m.7825 type:complete len:207 (-) Transcript_4465:453-1073(-)